jgi:predicted amidohydrolase
MRLSVAQFKPIAGDVAHNLKRHLELIELARSVDAEFLLFPEISLTGYEPKLAQEHATDEHDSRPNCIQDRVDFCGIVVAVGLPIRGIRLPLIGMVLIRPSYDRQLYCKQILHPDEYPFFEAGSNNHLLELKGMKIAPAICFESLQIEHGMRAHALGAQVYTASVAKSRAGLENAFKHYSTLAKLNKMTVLMSNCIGPSDDFVSAGGSAIWNREGDRVGQIGDSSEGVLCFDTERGDAMVKLLST